jgi:hypothetical protein
MEKTHTIKNFDCEKQKGFICQWNSENHLALFSKKNRALFCGIEKETRFQAIYDSDLYFRE